MFKFGRQRSTINILSTLEEKNKLEEDNEAFEEEEEDEEQLTVETAEGDASQEVTVKLRHRKEQLAGGSVMGTGRTKRSNSVMPMSSPSSLVLRGRDGRGAPVWMLERSRSAYIKPR